MSSEITKYKSTAEHFLTEANRKDEENAKDAQPKESLVSFTNENWRNDQHYRKANRDKRSLSSHWHLKVFKNLNLKNDYKR
jgi:hypothetical protein